jgi:transposase
MKEGLPALAESLSASANHPLIQQRIQRRASMVALSMEGIDHRTIAAFAQAHQRTIHRWVCRIQEGNLFTDLPRAGRPRTFSEAARLTTIAVYCQHAPPLPGVHLWSLRDAQRYFEKHPDIVGGPISRATIQRILLEHALRPHRRKYYLQITDPDFFAKMEPIIDLYLNPPDNLYCFDECTCIQALKRLTPDMPPAPGQPLLEDFDYKRNGTTDLIAFLNTATGKVYGQCVPNHNRHTLRRVFTTHVRTLPPEETIHYITDNLTTHYHEDFCKTVAKLSGVRYPALKTGAERRQWLASEDKRIVLHFVPFHASWLNLVEIWFGILKSKCLKYGHFFSVEQLCQDIVAFIDTWNECFAHPFSWSYTGDGLHAKAVRRFSQLLAIETDQMDCRFLKSQLLLMSNIAENYLGLIPPADWLRLLQLAVEKESYMTSIIEADTGPRRKKTAREAYARFVRVVIDRTRSLANTG